MHKQKKVFIYIILGFCFLIIVLPFLVSTNNILTKVLEKNLLYGFIQDNLVPIEAKMIGAILIPFGYRYTFSPTNSIISVNGVNMGITWNCLGWQSFLLFFITIIVGFRAKYRLFSVFEALLLGILGTFWVNILRMLFTILLAVHTPPIFRIVFHDYLAAFVTLVWLFFYWWFCYSYILLPKVIVKEGVTN